MGCRRHIQCEVYVCAECRNEALDKLIAEAEQLKAELYSVRSEIHAASTLLAAANDLHGHPGAYAVLKIERDAYKNALTKIAANAQRYTADWCRREALFGLGKVESASDPDGVG